MNYCFYSGAGHFCGALAAIPHGLESLLLEDVNITTKGKQFKVIGQCSQPSISVVGQLVISLNL